MLCVCVCVCERERERERGGETERGDRGWKDLKKALKKGY